MKKIFVSIAAAAVFCVAGSLHAELPSTPRMDICQTNGAVYAVAAAGGKIYIGGFFTTVNGVPRNRIAAIDAATGALTDWNPNANGTVYALAVMGDRIYAGGSFTSMDGMVRDRITALDATTGRVTGWTPSVNNGAVYAIAVSGNKVYFGGSFSDIDGVTYNCIAVLDDYGVASLSSGADNVVRTLAVAGNTLYAGGEFTSFGGMPRNCIAAWDSTTCLVTDWAPDANLGVYALAVNNGTVYAGGLFTSFGGVSRNYVAAWDSTTGLATDWNPNANGGVFSLAVNGGTVYAGGFFNRMGGITRRYAAAIDTTTGAVAAWDPNPDNYVYALTLYRGALYAGGIFNNFGMSSRSNFAQFGEYVPLAVTGISPAGGPLTGGTTVTITGTSFENGALLSVGGNAAANVTFVSSTTLTTVTPAGASLGAKDVSVTGPYGDCTVLAGGFTYAAVSTDTGTVVNTDTGTAVNTDTGTITVTIDPANSATVTISAPGGDIVIDVPQGTFSRAVTLTVSTAAPQAVSQETLKASQLFFDIMNSAALQPQQDITLTVNYRDADIAGLDETKLTLAYFNTGANRWLPIPSTVYPDQNRITGTVRHFTLFSILQRSPAGALSGVRAWPNPFSPKNAALTLGGLTADADIKIFTVAGELVRELHETDGDGQLAWDGKNSGGNDVASGVYLAFIKSGASSKTVKIAVER